MVVRSQGNRNLTTKLHIFADNLVHDVFLTNPDQSNFLFLKLSPGGLKFYYIRVGVGFII